jgi:hypothetical protein
MPVGKMNPPRFLSFKPGFIYNTHLLFRNVEDAQDIELGSLDENSGRGAVAMENNTQD